MESPLAFSFDFKGEEYNVVLQQASSVLKLIIKKPFEPFYWTAQLTDKDLISTDWKILGDLQTVAGFIKHCFDNKALSVDLSDEMKIGFTFVLDMQFKKQELKLVAVPTEIDPQKLNMELMNMVKELSKAVKGKMKWEDSRIISLEDYKLLTKWINPEKPEKVKLELLFKATRDGFTASAFHSKCDGQGPTLSVIKSTLGTVFGGYTTVLWHSNGAYTKDNSAFTFSLTHKQKCPIKLSAKAIYGHSSHLCTFGSGHDIHLCDSCSISTSSYSGGNSSYTIPEGVVADTFYAGSYNFFVKEIEVYVVKTLA